MARYRTIVLNLLELIIVLGLGFGLFWFSSFGKLMDGALPTERAITTSNFYFLVAMEVVLLAIIGSFLQFRKWSIKDFNLSFDWYMPGIALVLVVLRFGLGWILRQTIGWVGVDLGEAMHLQLEASVLSCLLVIIVNSIYEEVLLLGYLFKRLEKLSPTLIIIISMVVRESYHLYQGWYKLPMAISIGLVYGWFYYRYKKLWPPIIAHGITNAVGFFWMH